MSTITLLLILLLITTIGGLFFIVYLIRRPHTDNSSLLIQKQLEELREQVRKSLDGNANQLVKTNEAVGQRLDNAANVVRELGNRMAKVEEVSRNVLEVGKDISTLQQILKAPKLRGSFGEYLLGDLLCQMLPQENFELQYTFKNGERVDAIIKTTQGFVPVDAKFPLESFKRCLIAEDDESRKQARREFITSVKKHVNDIAQKYIKPGEGTFDFAFMYIPAENVYYEMITKSENIDESTTIAEYAISKKIFPVSPNTFYAYLHTILVGLRGLQIEKNVKLILKEISRLKQKFGAFAEDFENIGSHLKDAASSYGKAEKHLDGYKRRLDGIETPAIDDTNKTIELPQDESPKELVQ